MRLCSSSVVPQLFHVVPNGETPAGLRRGATLEVEVPDDVPRDTLR